MQKLLAFVGPEVEGNWSGMIRVLFEVYVSASAINVIEMGIEPHKAEADTNGPLK